jgi:hypothetical protein
MPMIRVRDKNLVILPGEVMQISLPAENKLAKLHRLAQSVPSVYKGRVKADAFISQQRDAWHK